MYVEMQTLQSSHGGVAYVWQEEVGFRVRGNAVDQVVAEMTPQQVKQVFHHIWEHSNSKGNQYSCVCQ